MTIKKLFILLGIGFVFAAVSAWAEENQSQVKQMDIGKITCNQLMSGNDLDREAHATQYVTRRNSSR